MKSKDVVRLYLKFIMGIFAVVVKRVYSLTEQYLVSPMAGSVHDREKKCAVSWGP